MDKPCLFDCESAKKLELENEKLRMCLVDIEDTAKQLSIMSIQQITRYALKKLEAGE